MCFFILACFVILLQYQLLDTCRRGSLRCHWEACPLLTTGHRRCSFWWQRSLGGCSWNSRNMCCPSGLSLAVPSTWSRLTGMHPGQPRWLHPSAALAFPGTWGRTLGTPIQEDAWLAQRFASEASEVFKISLLLCIPPFDLNYLNEAIFLETLSCWEETSCCGH